MIQTTTQTTDNKPGPEVVDVAEALRGYVRLKHLAAQMSLSMALEVTCKVAMYLAKADAFKAMDGAA